MLKTPFSHLQKIYVNFFKVRNYNNTRKLFYWLVSPATGCA
jgi:hypothetical protein